MAHHKFNRVRSFRVQWGWSQAALAERAKISRAAVSAIEQDRLTPSVTAALSLARTFGCTVEELFGDREAVAVQAEWAWEPPSTPCRYWQAEVGTRRVLYPAESTNVGALPHDGLWDGKARTEVEAIDPAQVLVVATCDPAVGLLGAEYARQSPFRLLPLSRSSRDALQLMTDRKIHAAGVHLSASDRDDGNAAVVRERFGSGFALLRGGVWQEGIAVASRLKLRSPGAAVRSRLSWVGREEGSGARQCLDELLTNRRPPRRMAPDHRGVALAIRCGWADAGVCLRLASEEAGLTFLELRREAYDLCFPAEFENDRRLQALVEIVRSARYRRLVDALPGYENQTTGELTAC